MRMAVTGEAVIDFTGRAPLAFQGHVGGSPLNTAVACARLGQPTGFVSQLSTDLFGERLLQHLHDNGVDTRFVLRSAAPSALAFVERTPITNRYAFYWRGSADSAWAPDPLPSLPAECAALHYGSIALLQEPAASRIVALVAAHRTRLLTVFDPNVRPSVVGDLSVYRERMDGWLAHAALMKLSIEDAEALAPGEPLATAAERWLRGGPAAVVVTRGEQGATLFRLGAPPVDVVAPAVSVVDTIGAGDTFCAGLSVALVERGVTDLDALRALGEEAWREVLRFAAMAAALNCTREGADPPRRDEVLRALAAAA